MLIGDADDDDDDSDDDDSDGNDVGGGGGIMVMVMVAKSISSTQRDPVCGSLKPSDSQKPIKRVCFLKARVTQCEMRHLGSVRVRSHVHDRNPQQGGIEATELNTRHTVST